MNTKVVFWLEPNQSLVPVDLIPGAIAEARYPLPERCEAEGQALGDPHTAARLIEECEQVEQLRKKFPSLPSNATFSIGDAKNYLASLGLEVEIHHELVGKQRCIELAALNELTFKHWEELTGIGLGADSSYACKLSGIFPKQFSEAELLGLTKNERQAALDMADGPLLQFPCTPDQLVQFIDSSLPGEFDLPQWFREAVARKAGAEFSGTYNEVMSNGKSIDWRYWMSMKTLSAGEAARLLVGLDPDIFVSLDQKGPTRNDTSGQRDKAKKIERLALNRGMTEATASDWIAWAKTNGFNIHQLFVIEVESKVANSETTKTEAPAIYESAKPIPRQRFQEMEILRVISDLGHDPKNLPKDISGKPGVKAEVRSRLTFTIGVFDKAWERLAKANDISKSK